jgi:hypothetical protein
VSYHLSQQEVQNSTQAQGLPLSYVLLITMGISLTLLLDAGLVLGFWKLLSWILF